MNSLRQQNSVVIWSCSNTLSQPCSMIAKSNSNHSQMLKVCKPEGTSKGKLL